MKGRCMSVYRTLTREQRKELRKLYNEEHKGLCKRPMYWMGNLIIAGLVLYFLFRGLGYEVSRFPRTADIIGSIGGLGAALIVMWLLCKWFKA